MSRTHRTREREVNPNREVQHTPPYSSNRFLSNQSHRESDRASANRVTRIPNSGRRFLLGSGFLLNHSRFGRFSYIRFLLARFFRRLLLTHFLRCLLLTHFLRRLLLVLQSIRSDDLNYSFFFSCLYQNFLLFFFCSHSIFI